MPPCIFWLFSREHEGVREGAMGRFIPRHRLKAGALALPLRACRLGRSVGHF